MDGEALEAGVVKEGQLPPGQAAIQTEAVLTLGGNVISNLCVHGVESLATPLESSVLQEQLCAISATGRAITRHSVSPKLWLPLTN